jgi:outer membrane receptor protein involved in Fe transport
MVAPVAAATAPVPQDAVADTQVADIVVTAQKRSESLQRVPIAVTAFDQRSLDASGIRNTQDLAFRTPGLQFSAAVAQGQPTIRGIGNTDLSGGVSGAVAVHLDGFYQAHPGGALADLYDIGRVEVLKGPQGTLYGRNATGGAINIIAAVPTHRFEGTVDGLVGSFGDLQLRGAINVPLGGGADFRVAFNGHAAREFAARVNVGMVGINVPIPVPVAYHSFGGWKRSAFGDHNQHGMEGVRFWTKVKTVTQRWPDGGAGDSAFTIPTMK